MNTSYHCWNVAKKASPLRYAYKHMLTARNLESVKTNAYFWLTTAMVRYSCRANGTGVSWLPVQCVRRMNFCLLEGVYDLLRSHQDRLCIPLTDHGHDTDACQLALPRSTFGCCAAIHPATTLFSSRPGSRHSRTV